MGTMIAATRAEQRRLLDLQQVDIRIRQLRHRRANLPEQKALDERTDLLHAVESELVAARERLDRLERDQRRHERELDVVEARYSSETQRKYSGAITSPKELIAVDAELVAMEQRRGDLEDTLLEIMEQRDETESLIATLEDRNAELTREVATATKERDEAVAGIQTELGASVAERKTVASELPKPVLAYYDDLRARKDGLAVAELQGRTCAGCRLELTVNELEEVRNRAERGLARCEQCGRILIIP
jgi:predicted  nucleic acid-binding Zn-ribbon protein